MSDQHQTAYTFREKWTHNPSLAFKETLDEQSEIFGWILRRNGLSGPDAMRAWLSRRRRILDAGCGNGRVTALLRRYAPPYAEIVGVDLVSADIARDNLKNLGPVHVEAADLLSDLSRLGEFDLIYCQEVLHHTGDPRGAFLNLCSRLSPRGEIAIYVYKKKAPVREFVDDMIRAQVASLPYDETIAHMEGIAQLGRVLSELRATVRIPSIPVLGIVEGEYDVQRFLYHYFVKCFWNPKLSAADNVAVNYDWYHPELSTRHTLEEIETWIAQANLTMVHTCVDEYGITARAIRGS